MTSGPNTTFEYIGKMSLVLNLLRCVTNHFEKDMGTLTRGKKHKTPSPYHDIDELMRDKHTNQVHRYNPGHKAGSGMPNDFVSKGVKELTLGMKSMKIYNWFMQRARGIARACTQIWNDSDGFSTSDHSSQEGGINLEEKVGEEVQVTNENQGTECGELSMGQDGNELDEFEGLFDNLEWNYFIDGV